MPKQYIAKNKVVKTQVDPDVKTPRGGDVLIVTYENGVKELMPKKTFDLFATPGQVDFTSFRDLKHQQIVREILAVVADYDVKFRDLKNLFQMAIDSINDNYDRAINYLWTRDDNQFIPGANSLEERTFIECHKVLSTIPVKTTDTANPDNTPEPKGDDEKGDQKPE